MRSPSPSSLIKQEFLEKWLKGLRVYSGTSKEMSILERKNAIKLSADVAMASTRISTSSWSRALMAKASNDAKNKPLVSNVLDNEDPVAKITKQDSKDSMIMRNMMSKRVRSKKILRKSCSNRIRRTMRKRTGAAAHVIEASCIAKRLLKKRTKVLKILVPGGEYMDGISLIRETLDYILSLTLQVDVMRHLANAADKLDQD